MVNPVPDIPSVIRTTPSGQGIKAATPDLFVYSEVEDSGVLEDLLFESLAGQELINIARHDTINGQSIVYRPIKNVSSIALKYSPQNLLSLQNPSNAYFNNFPIKFQDRVPEIDDLRTFLNNSAANIVMLDDQTGDLLIYVVDMEDDERLEIQILSAGEVLDGTIY
jgi:hypothetical protein